MKRVGKRILALFLCACLCVGFMPTIPALALANGSNNVVEAAEIGKLDDSFEGLVFEFHDLKASEGKDAVRLDVYTHVAQPFQAFNARLIYDSSSVLMTDSSLGNVDDYAADENKDYTSTAFFPAKIGANELLTTKGGASSGIGAGKLTTESHL